MDPTPPQPEDSGDQPAPLSPESQPPILRSDELFGTHREVWIEHGDTMYRLRKTRAGKLYLTK